MKPSKLIFALAGIMTVAGASALTTEEIRARCNSSKDTVWDSFNKTCVPKNPCKKDGYMAYCNREFQEAKVGSKSLGESLAKAYIRFTDGHTAKCESVKSGMLGHDYLGCTYDNGHYVVFEFDSLSKSGDADVSLPSKLTELRGSGEYGCYGYPHDESFDHNTKYGQWVKSPILPSNLCFISGQNTDAVHDKFCAVDDGNVLFAESALGLIYAAKYDDAFGVGRYGVIGHASEVSPDGTNVSCIFMGLK